MLYYTKFLSTKCFTIFKYFLAEFKEKSYYHFLESGKLFQFRMCLAWFDKWKNFITIINKCGKDGDPQFKVKETASKRDKASLNGQNPYPSWLNCHSVLPDSNFHFMISESQSFSF